MKKIVLIKDFEIKFVKELTRLRDVGDSYGFHIPKRINDKFIYKNYAFPVEFETLDEEKGVAFFIGEQPEDVKPRPCVVRRENHSRQEGKISLAYYLGIPKSLWSSLGLPNDWNVKASSIMVELKAGVTEDGKKVILISRQDYVVKGSVKRVEYFPCSNCNTPMKRYGGWSIIFQCPKCKLTISLQKCEKDKLAKIVEDNQNVERI